MKTNEELKELWRAYNDVDLAWTTFSDARASQKAARVAYNAALKILKNLKGDF